MFVYIYRFAGQQRGDVAAQPPARVQLAHDGLGLLVVVGGGDLLDLGDEGGVGRPALLREGHDAEGLLGEDVPFLPFKPEKDHISIFSICPTFSLSRFMNVFRKTILINIVLKLSPDHLIQTNDGEVQNHQIRQIWKSTVRNKEVKNVGLETDNATWITICHLVRLANHSCWTDGFHYKI